MIKHTFGIVVFLPVLRSGSDWCFQHQQTTCKVTVFELFWPLDCKTCLLSSVIIHFPFALALVPMDQWFARQKLAVHKASAQKPVTLIILGLFGGAGWGGSLLWCYYGSVCLAACNSLHWHQNGADSDMCPWHWSSYNISLQKSVNTRINTTKKGKWYREGMDVRTGECWLMLAWSVNPKNTCSSVCTINSFP